VAMVQTEEHQLEATKRRQHRLIIRSRRRVTKVSRPLSRQRNAGSPTIEAAAHSTPPNDSIGEQVLILVTDRETDRALGYTTDDEASPRERITRTAREHAHLQVKDSEPDRLLGRPSDRRAPPVEGEKTFLAKSSLARNGNYEHIDLNTDWSRRTGDVLTYRLVGHNSGRSYHERVGGRADSRRLRTWSIRVRVYAKPLVHRSNSNAKHRGVDKRILVCYTCTVMVSRRWAVETKRIKIEANTTFNEGLRNLKTPIPNVQFLPQAIGQPMDTERAAKVLQVSITPLQNVVEVQVKVKHAAVHLTVEFELAETNYRKQAYIISSEPGSNLSQLKGGKRQCNDANISPAAGNWLVHMHQTETELEIARQAIDWINCHHLKTLLAPDDDSDGMEYNGTPNDSQEQSRGSVRTVYEIREGDTSTADELGASAGADTEPGSLEVPNAGPHDRADTEVEEVERKMKFGYCAAIREQDYILVHVTGSPEVRYAVTDLAQFSDLAEEYSASRSVLHAPKYQSQTKDEGNTYRQAKSRGDLPPDEQATRPIDANNLLVPYPSRPDEPDAYVIAAYAPCTMNRRSAETHAVTPDESAAYYKGKWLTTTGTRPTEADGTVAADNAIANTYLRQPLNESSTKQVLPTSIYGDNVTACLIANKGKFMERSLHNDTKSFTIKVWTALRVQIDHLHQHYEKEDSKLRY